LFKKYHTELGLSIVKDNPKSLFVLQETPQVCYNKAILKKYLSPKR